MTHHENQAVRFLEERKDAIEMDIVDLERKRAELEGSLEANVAAQAEKLSALSDINQLLDHISS